MPFPGYDHLNGTTIDSEFHGISNSSCDLVRSSSRIPTQAHDTDDTSISNDDSDSLPENTITLVSLGAASESKLKLPLSMYFIMAIPAFLDLGATALLIAGKNDTTSSSVLPSFVIRLNLHFVKQHCFRCLNTQDWSSLMYLSTK
jgi:hypothetical protein